MRAAPRTSYTAIDAKNARDFFIDVLALPYTRADGGTRMLTVPPSALGLHPRRLTERDRIALGATGVALTCEDLPEITAELAASGALLMWAGFTSDRELINTFMITIDQGVDLVAAGER